VTKALVKEPAKRYQHVDEMLVDLKSATRILESGPAETINERFSKRKRAFLYGGMTAFLILLIAAGLYFFPQRRETIDSIAVLPLANLSGDPEQEYFADGMTEAMITELAKVKALRVISRTSVMQFKNTAKPLPEIARQLNVDAIVEGSVLRSGEQVRITAQLIEAKTDRHLWADSYERDLREILTLQRQVALAITHEIQIKLTPQEQALLGDAKPVNPEAYDLYLWALKYRDMNDHEMTVHYCERAIEVDPDFAPAYALMVIPYVGSARDEPKEVESKARRIAAKALQLDKTNADAHIALGFIREIYDWDWAGAEEEFKRAIELKPNSKLAYYDYGLFLCRVGRPEEGLAELKRAQAIEPLSESVNAYIVWAYCFNRRYDEAIEQGRKALMLHPISGTIHARLGEAYVRKGMYKEAIAVFESEMMASGSWRLGFLGCAYALAGQREKSLKIISDLQTQPKRFSKEHIAMIYTYLGEKKEALTWLERAYNEHSIYLIIFVFDPLFDPLRSEPRFQALLKKMRLD
jgi:TolB-like protein